MSRRLANVGDTRVRLPPAPPISPAVKHQQKVRSGHDVVPRQRDIGLNLFALLGGVEQPEHYFSMNPKIKKLIENHRVLIQNTSSTELKLRQASRDHRDIRWAYNTFLNTATFPLSEEPVQLGKFGMLSDRLEVASESEFRASIIYLDACQELATFENSKLAPALLEGTK